MCKALDNGHRIAEVIFWKRKSAARARLQEKREAEIVIRYLLISIFLLWHQRQNPLLVTTTDGAGHAAAGAVRAGEVTVATDAADALLKAVDDLPDCDDLRLSPCRAWYGGSCLEK